MGVVMGSATMAAQAPLHSDDLLQGQKTVSIVHNGSTYRVQATKLGKLILPK
jgi:hemin uptake protein HemP